MINSNYSYEDFLRKLEREEERNNYESQKEEYLWQLADERYEEMMIDE